MSISEAGVLPSKELVAAMGKFNDEVIKAGVLAADGAYERAIGLEADPAVRRFLQRRRAELRGGPLGQPPRCERASINRGDAATPFH